MHPVPTLSGSRLLTSRGSEVIELSERSRRATLGRSISRSTEDADGDRRMSTRGFRWQFVAGQRPSRRGYSLVFVALMLFGIMALAGLVIDLGFARLAQRQMQVAADNAAVEGLRGEGNALYPYSGRRDAARDFVHWHFDNDLDASGTYPLDDDGAFGTGSGQFGAGPQLTFSGGLGDPAMDASRTIEVDQDNPVYKPVMQDGTQSPANTFQIAMRRGGMPNPIADLSSQGPAVPYLFARGSLSNRQLISAGINVGANGIAGAENAISIGLADDTLSPPLPGLLPLALELSYWNSLTNGIPDSQTVTSGTIGTAGRFFAVATADPMPLAVGRTLPAASVAADGTYVGYVPIYASLTATSTERVVGFGEAEVIVSSLGSASQITRRASRIGAENVSPVLCHDVVWTSVEAEEVFSLRSSVEEPLQAAAVRNTGP